jgi:hypothetical protein
VALLAAQELRAEINASRTVNHEKRWRPDVFVA